MMRRLVLVGFTLVLAFLVQSLFAAAGPSFPCSSAGPFYTITFVNNSGVAVDILWIDFQCNEVLYHDAVPNGQTRIQGTFGTHPWVVRNDTTGALLYCFVATQDETITITATSTNRCSPQAPAPVVTPVPATPPVPVLFTDGRINNHLWSDGAAPVAVYCNQTEGLNVYGANADNVGILLIHVDAAIINESSVPETENYTLAEAGNVVVSRLTSGEFQINASYSDGKSYSLIWEGCPVVNSYTSVG